MNSFSILPVCSKEVLDDALKVGGYDTRIIKLLRQKDDTLLTLDSCYAGHSQFPHLARDAAVAHALTPILSAPTQ